MDYLLLWVYFLLLGIITLKSRDRQKTDESYFLNRRNTPWFYSLISVFATETSVATILVFPSTGYSQDFSILFLGLGYISGRILVALLYLKHYHSFPSLSLYEHVSTPEGKYYLSFAFLLAKYISGSVRFFLAGYVVYRITQIPVPVSLSLMAVFVGLYSLTGGLRSVILTDQIQGFFIFASGLFLSGYLYLSLPQHSFELPSPQPDHSLSLFLAGLLLTVSSHGADQDILQRIFAVSDLRKAQISLMTSGIVVFAVIVIFTFLGYLLSLTGSYSSRSPLVDFVLSLEGHNPAGIFIKNLFLVLVFSAAMSTIDSTIHSTGAIWKSLFPFQKVQNYRYSLFSLFVMYLLSQLYIFYYENKDFLSLSLGMMNYVNGVLFSLITLFVLYRKKIGSPVIISALVTNILITSICEFFQLYFALTTIISFLSTFLVSAVLFRFSSNGFLDPPTSQVPPFSGKDVRAKR